MMRYGNEVIRTPLTSQAIADAQENEITEQKCKSVMIALFVNERRFRPNGKFDALKVVLRE